MLVVSNRLPFVVVRNEEGNLIRKPSAGGLVTAVAPVVVEQKGIWIGWPGMHFDNADEAIPEPDRDNTGPTAGLSSKQVSLHFSLTMSWFHSILISLCLCMLQFNSNILDLLDLPYTLKICMQVFQTVAFDTATNYVLRWKLAQLRKNVLYLSSLKKGFVSESIIQQSWHSNNPTLQTIDERMNSGHCAQQCGIATCTWALLLEQ